MCGMDHRSVFQRIFRGTGGCRGQSLEYAISIGLREVPKDRTTEDIVLLYTKEAKVYVENGGTLP